MARRKKPETQAPQQSPQGKAQEHTRDSLGALVGNTLHPHKLDRLASQLNRHQPVGPAATSKLLVRVVPLLGTDHDRRKALVRGICGQDDEQ